MYMFALSRKVPIGFVVSVHLSVCARFSDTWYWDFHEISVEKIQMRLKSEMLGPFHEDLSIFQIIGCDMM